MENEVVKHANKILGSVNSSHDSLGHKMKEIGTEVFIIVFAVTLSIWLHSRSEHRAQQKEVQEFLSDLKDDLRADIITMNGYRKLISDNDKIGSMFINITPQKMDSLKNAKEKIGIPGPIFIIEASHNGNFEGFKSSGRIGYMGNKKIKNDILHYYQIISPILEKIQNIFNSLATANNFGESKDSKSSEIVFRGAFQETIQKRHELSQSLTGLYGNAIKSAENIITEIEAQEK